MPKYRKKPIIIEAIQFFNGDGKNTIAECISFTCGELCIEEDECGSCHGLIPTLEGSMQVSDCDYIIKGIKGEFYPCKPDIFEMTYEKVEEDE